MQVSEDSGTNWEAGYFDCLVRKVDSSRYLGILGVATDIRLNTPPDPGKVGVHNQAGLVNALVVGGLEQSLGIVQSVDEAITVLRRLLAQ
jgi:hypothetical protein